LCNANTTPQEKPNVCIRGYVTEKVFSVVKVASADRGTTKEIILASDTVKPDNSFFLSFYIQGAKAIRLFNAQVFVTEGDTVDIVSDGNNNILSAKGKNSGNYIFFSDPKYKTLNKYFNPTNFQDEWQSYKDSLDYRLRLKRIFMAESSSKISNNLFQSVSINDLYEYYHDLLNPINRKLMFPRNTPSNYLDEIKTVKFNDAYLSSNQYMMFAFAFIDYSVPDNNLLKRTNFILGNFNNKTKEALLMTSLKIFINFEMNEYIKIKENKKEIKELIQKTEMNISDTYYKEEFQKYKVIINSTYSKIAENITQISLIEKSGIRTFFSDILKNNSKKLIYVDVWASWCGPCIEQMTYLKKYEEKIQESTNIISISVDTDSEKWKNAMKKYNLERNQYLMPNESAKEFNRSLNIDGIPRYILINNDGDIISWNAPSPKYIDKLLLIIKNYTEKVNKK
jgi:thiol-disulfide isomerase/thioredoxin